VCKISAYTLSWDICRGTRHTGDDRAGLEPEDTPDVSGTLAHHIALVDHTRVRVSEAAPESPLDTKDMAADRIKHLRGSSLGMIELVRHIGLPIASLATSGSLVDSEAVRSDSVALEAAVVRQSGKDIQSRAWLLDSLCHQDELSHSESVVGSAVLFGRRPNTSAVV